MNHSLRKLIHSSVATVTALGLSTMGLATSAFAGQLTGDQLTLSNTDTSKTGVTYAFKFTVPTTYSIGKVAIAFSTTASGALNAPVGFDSSGGSVAVSVADINGGSTITDLTGGTLTKGTNTLSLLPVSPVPITSGQYLDLSFTNIVNPTNPESDYAQITLYAADGTTVSDTGTTSFTVITPITVTAVVDPYMTFTVAGVTSNWGTVDPQLSSNGGTAITNVTGTAIPFGNVTVGGKKYGTQSLSVRTNSGGGYKVYHKFTTAQVAGGDVVLSSASNNKMDPFIGSSATFSSPQLWSSPTGNSTVNNNTAWVGIRTTGVSAFTATDVWAPPALVSISTGNIVKSSTTPDNGFFGTNTYVSYQVEVNAFQPSDSYTGTMQYNVVAPY